MRERIGALLLCACAACAESGALGQANITGECDVSDALCLAEGLQAPLAVGTSMTLNIDTTTLGATAPTFALEALDESVLGVEGTHIEGRAPGISALFVVSDDVVVDFIHLFVEAPDGLRIERSDGISPGLALDRLELLPGDDLRIEAAFEHREQRLLGAPEIEWAVEGDAITLLDEGRVAHRRIVARSAGPATITAHSGELEATFDVEVLP